jgi:hypothetical protein
MQHLNIIDILGPFAIRNNRDTVNWSKINFRSLETGNRITPSTHKKIVERCEHYISQVSALGYDSISIDDLAHLASFDFYSPTLKRLLKDYLKLYKEIFAIAKRHGLKIFVNTDYLFFNDDIHKHLEESGQSPVNFYSELLEQTFTALAEVDGIIMRVGENDGKDVENIFLSQLLLKTPSQANELLTRILPIFERHNKTLIFRTWTVGVYEIGDLIWNEKTYDAVFESIKSDALIISMKFGDTDFMRYLRLNPLFGHGQHKKIIELQTRREWEGMGEFPSFVGWDYQEYLRQLADNKNIVGVHVWCQTGGWAKRAWSTATYFDERAFWNELNTEVTIDIAKHKLSVEAAIERFCKSRKIDRIKDFIELLHLADTAILKGLYVPDVARKSLYFRRSRVPSLTWLMWDRAHLSPLVISLHQLFVASPRNAIRDADQAVEATKRMVQIAQNINLPAYAIDSLEFERSTLTLFAQLKRYMFNMLSPQQIQNLNQQVRIYKTRWPQHYSIPQLKPKSIRKTPRPIFNLFIRRTLPYRKRDKILLKTSHIQAWTVRLYLRRSKSHLASQSMGIDTLFN